MLNFPSNVQKSISLKFLSYMLIFFQVTLKSFNLVITVPNGNSKLGPDFCYRHLKFTGKKLCEMRKGSR